jgi:hypothetical protein
MKKLSYIAAGIAGSVLLGTLGVVGYEERVEARIDRLLASGELPSPARTDPGNPPLVRDFDRLTEELDRTIRGSIIRMAQEYPTPFAPWRWREEHRDELAYLVDTAEVLDDMDRLLESPQARFIVDGPRRIVSKPGERIPRMYKLRRWANALSARAIVNARRGEYRQAARSLRHACEIGRLVDDGSIIGLMVQTVTSVVAYGAAEQIIQDDLRAAPALRRELDPTLVALRSSSRVMEAIGADLATLLARVREQEDWGYDLWPTSPFNIPKRAWVAQWIDEILNEYERTRFNSPEELRHRLDGQQEIWNQRHCPGPLMIWEGTLRSSMWQDRRAEHFRVVLAAASYRDRHGSWPVNLDELKPDFDDNVPLDPSTGTPFRYEVGPECVLLAPAGPYRDYLEHDSPWASCKFEWRVPSERNG